MELVTQFDQNMNEHAERCIVVGFLLQSAVCIFVIYKQFPPKQNIVPAHGNFSAEANVYQFHEDMLPDYKVLAGDDEDEEGFPRRRGPTESPQLQRMRIQLYSLNYAQAPADDPEVVQIVRNYWIRWPSKYDYSLSDPNRIDFSHGQSLIVDKLLGHQNRGFFVECGAFDGETGSNTLYFEKRKNWTGLLIEADSLNYQKITYKNRKAFMSPACLGIHSYPTVMSFNRGNNRGRLIDDVKTFDWIRNQGLTLKQSETQCFPFHSFLLALNRTTVDYLSLDVEGIEMRILRTIPFKKLNIRIMSIRYAYITYGGKIFLQKFIERNGFKLVFEFKYPKHSGYDLIFQKRNDIKITK